jgi:hypothetical protein
MFKLALAAILRLHNPTVNLDHVPHDRYTLADLAANNPYTEQDWETDIKRKQCQCFVVKVSPEGNVIGTSRACDCNEVKP